MKIGILDIGTHKISCFIVNIVKDKEPIILGIGHHQSNGISSGTIIDMELACNSIRSSIQSAENMFGSCYTIWLFSDGGTSKTSIANALF